MYAYKSNLQTLFLNNKCIQDQVNDNQSSSRDSRIFDVDITAQRKRRRKCTDFSASGMQYVKTDEAGGGDSEIDFRIECAECKFYELGKKYMNHKIAIRTRVKKRYGLGSLIMAFGV